MNSGNHVTQDFPNLPTDQTRNNSVTSQITDNNETFQHASNNNTFEFYLPLPNDTRIYHVTYTELNSTEIAQFLNNNINSSHIPKPVNYQQNTIQQQSFNNMNIQPTFQEYSDNNAYDTNSISPNGAIPEDTSG
ncbi:unnamed protein product [Rhizophagus irregularis]|uniref:Uncharacterized protein n=1 Tax=Rhizophagus irregularis TaxID=588596 RepID=A0A2I1FZ98_9GLOM|nr:hypothetical protein RhiirA4_393808 [Rhizophagus irregularis]CAB4414296.1 unnamed protein product [Rhizophagus irregularis]CAB4414850.1 unnamed protein product [Rhizophagus irregularis]